MNLPPAASPPPRAFAQGVGLVMQTLGAILFLSGCCVCSSGWAFEDRLSADQIGRELRENPLLHRAAWSAQPAKAGVMLGVMASTVGGLAMAVLGLGLQSDKPRAALGALLCTATFALVLLLAGVLLWLEPLPWGWRLWHHTVLLLVLTLLGMCVAALRQTIQHPPPREQATITDAELRAMGVLTDDVLAQQPNPDAKELAKRKARLVAEQRRIADLETKLRSHEHRDKP